VRDLVEAMDRRDVEESEIKYLNATWNVLQLPDEW
jgi:hypothetical protein